MTALLKVVDQQFGASAATRRAGVALRLASERASAREIIRSRVDAEVREINQAVLARIDGAARSFLIADRETQLNPPPVSTRAWRSLTPLDVETEFERAVNAFMRRRFIMLLDDRQIDGLDDPVGLRPESEVVFVHLTPLKGG